MQAVLFSLVIPLCYFILSTLLNTIMFKIKKAQPLSFHKKTWEFNDIKQLSVVFAAVMIMEWIEFLIMHFLISNFMVSDVKEIPAIIICLVSVLPFLAVFAFVWTDKKNLQKFIKYTALISVIVMIAEVVIFNGKSSAKSDMNIAVSVQYMTVDGNAVIEDDKIIISGDGTVTMNDFPSGTRGLILNMSQEKSDESRRFHIKLGMKDENFKTKYQIVQDKYTMAYDKPCTFSFNPYGDAVSLQISFSEITKPVTLYRIDTVSALPFSFSSVRYMILFLILVLIAAVKIFALYKIDFQPNKVSHISLVILMTVLCTLSSYIFFPLKEESIEYNADMDYSLFDPYIQVFHAWQKGQVFLDIEPSPELENLENVYDSGERNDSGIYFKWDYAYYKGHYYCYFGIAPVITFYYPFYWITGKLPLLATSVPFFSMLAIFFLCMTIQTMARLMIHKPNLILLLLSMPASVGCSGLYYIMNYADKYCLPLASGLCFLFLCLWLGMYALCIENKKIRIVLFAVSGISLALCFASRPSMALGASILVPLFLGVVFNKKYKMSFRLIQASGFVIPMMIGICGIMWYNNARFGSPLDFGASYQLTVSDIHANKIRLSGIFPAIYHFFLQIPRPRTTFPFFESQFYSFNNYGNYTYIADAIGVFSYPMMTAGALLFPISVKRKETISSSDITQLQRNSFMIACFVMALFIAWQDFCLGGVINRYVIDIMPLMILGSLMAILYRTRKPSECKYLYILCGISMLITFCMSWLMTIEIKDGSLSKYNPNFFDILEDMLIFWS